MVPGDYNGLPDSYRFEMTSCEIHVRLQASGMRSRPNSCLCPLQHRVAGTPVCPVLRQPLHHCRSVRKPAVSSMERPPQLLRAWQTRTSLPGGNRKAQALKVLLTISRHVTLKHLWQGCKMHHWRGTSALTKTPGPCMSVHF